MPDNIAAANIITPEDVAAIRARLPRKDLDPGDQGAREIGCTCPVYPNHTRNAARKAYGIFYVQEDCPVHGWKGKPEQYGWKRDLGQPTREGVLNGPLD